MGPVVEVGWEAQAPMKSSFCAGLFVRVDPVGQRLLDLAPTTGVSVSCLGMAASFPIEEALHRNQDGSPNTQSVRAARTPLPQTLSISSAVLDGGPFHRQGGDVSLDEGVEAGDVSRVRLNCFQVAVGEDLGV